jgi:hypothetical protein
MGQQPPNLHEIEAGKWIPYRGSDENDVTSNTEWTRLKKGEIAECVMWHPLNIDSYRWYPQKYLEAHLKRKTHKDESEYEWIASDPDNNYTMRADRLDSRVHQYKHWFSSKRIEHKWNFKTVENFYTAKDKGLFASYTAMPPLIAKLTRENCFNVYVTYIQRHLRKKNLQIEFVDFERFKVLKCNTDAGPKPFYSSLRIMWEKHVVYKLPLCIIKSNELNTVKVYAQTIIDACNELLRFVASPQEMPRDGWIHTFEIKEAEAYMFYSTKYISDKDLNEVHVKIITQLRQYVANFTSTRLMAYLAYLEIDDNVLRDLCRYDNDGRQNIGQKLFKCFNEPRGTLWDQASSREPVFKVDDYKRVGEAFLSAARVFTLVFDGGVLKRYLPPIKYGVRYYGKDHSIYATARGDQSAITGNTPTTGNFQKCVNFVRQNLITKQLNPDLVVFNRYELLHIMKNDKLETIKSTFDIMCTMAYVFKIPLCDIQTSKNADIQPYLPILQKASDELFRDHSKSRMDAVPQEDLALSVSSIDMLHYRISYSSGGLSRSQLNYVRGIIFRDFKRYLNVSNPSDWDQSFFMLRIEINDKVLCDLCRYEYDSNYSVNGKMLFKYKQGRKDRLGFQSPAETVGEIFLQAARISTYIYVDGCVKSVMPEVKYGVRYDHRKKAVFAVYPRSQR